MCVNKLSLQKNMLTDSVQFLFTLDSFIDEDSKRLEKIKESVLLPTKDREERKARVNKYLQWVRETGPWQTINLVIISCTRQLPIDSLAGDVLFHGKILIIMTIIAN